MTLISMKVLVVANFLGKTENDLNVMYFIDKLIMSFVPGGGFVSLD
jgi:hypothetical protein